MYVGSAQIIHGVFIKPDPVTMYLILSYIVITTQNSKTR